MATQAAPASAAEGHLDPTQYQSRQGGSFEKEIEVQPVDIEELFDPNSGYWDDPQNWNDMDYVWKLKVERLQRELHISPEEAPKFRKDYDISKGYLTLEWILPSPPPEHTFEELPIIKETEEELSTSFEARTSRVLEQAYRAGAVQSEHTQALEAILSDFGRSGQDSTLLKELLQRYARRELPSFPNEYSDQHHHH